MEESLVQVAEAITALGRDDPGAARAAMAGAVAKDRALSSLADAVAYATAELESEGAVSVVAWNALADACPQELRSVVEMSRR